MRRIVVIDAHPRAGSFCAALATAYVEESRRAGAEVERLTTEGHFNSFPMFSPDGKRLVWVSDRNTTARGEFNVFLADWVP